MNLYGLRPWGALAGLTREMPIRSPWGGVNAIAPGEIKTDILSPDTENDP